MSLNESIVEDAALEWFGELGYAVVQKPQITPGKSTAEQESFKDRGWWGLREANRRLALAIHFRTLAILLDSLLSKLSSADISLKPDKPHTYACNRI